MKFPDFCEILRIFQQIEHFSPQISRNFAGIAGNDRELLEVCEFCRKMQKHFRGKGKTEGMGKREIEIECQEMGNGNAPNLKSQARFREVLDGKETPSPLRIKDAEAQLYCFARSLAAPLLADRA